MGKINIDGILVDIIGVLFNNEGDNSPEDICDYVDSETLLDYMLEENDDFLSGFLTYMKTSYENNKYYHYGNPYFKVLHAMLFSPSYKTKCEDFMNRYDFDIDIIKRDF